MNAEELLKSVCGGGVTTNRSGRTSGDARGALMITKAIDPSVITAATVAASWPHTSLCESDSDGWSFRHTATRDEPERLFDIARGLPPICRTFRETASDDRVEQRRQVEATTGQGRGWCSRMAAIIPATGSIERLACRCHLVRSCAQCESSPTIGLSALQLFGRHVGDCAKDRAIVGDCLRRSGRT